MVVGGASVGAGPAARPSSPVTTGQDRVLVAVLSAVAMALAVAATWQGPGLTVDSVNYLTSAISLADTGDMVMLAGQPMTVFPPGLPAVAALGELVGIGAETTLRVVSIVSFGAIVVLGHRLLRRVVAHRVVVLAATGLLAISPALLGVSKMAWSEPPFVAITLLFLLSLGAVCARRTFTTRDLVVLAAWCSVAFLLRYIGLALIVTAGIALLATVRPLDRRALLRIVAFGAASAVVPVACMLRNRAADGTYLGNRLPSHDSLGDVGTRIAATLGEWVLPSTEAATRTLALVGGVGTLLVVAGLALATRGGRDGAPARGLVDGASRVDLLCCTILVVLYVVYLAGAALSTTFEPLNSRYLIPVYVPAVVISSAGVAAVLARLPRGVWRGAVGALAALFLVLQLGTSVEDARDGADHGIGYNADGVADSELAARASRLIGDDDGSTTVYSNMPPGLWAASGVQPILWAPRDTGFRGVPAEGELDALVWQVACRSDTTYLVLHFFGSPRVVGLDEIAEAVDVERVEATDDGAIFRLTSKATPDCDGDPPTCSLDAVEWRCEGARTARAVRP